MTINIDEVNLKDTEEVLKIVDKIMDKKAYWSKKIMALPGLWFYTEKYVRYTCRVVIIFIIIIGIASSVVRFVKESHSFGSNKTVLIETAFQILALTAILICYLLIIKFEKETTELMITMSLNYLRSPPDLITLTDNYGQWINIISLIQSIMMSFFTVSYALAPVVMPACLNFIIKGNKTYHKGLPMYTEFFVNQDEYFYIIYTIQFAVIFIYSIMINALNTYQWCGLGGSIMYLSYVKIEVQKTDEEYLTMKKLKKGKILNDWICKRIISNIKLHLTALKLFDMYNDIGSLIMFVIVFLTGTCLVISAFWMVIIARTDTAAAIRMLSALAITTCAIFFICIPSQLLDNTNTTLYHSYYDSNWVEYPPKARLHMLLMMIRASQPIFASAGPLFDLNIETFGNIMRTAFSYITTLGSIIDES